MSGDPISIPAVLVAGVATPEPLGALYPDYIGHCSSKCEYNNHNDGVMGWWRHSEHLDQQHQMRERNLICRISESEALAIVYSGYGGHREFAHKGAGRGHSSGGREKWRQKGRKGKFFVYHQSWF